MNIFLIIASLICIVICIKCFLSASGREEKLFSIVGFIFCAGLLILSSWDTYFNYHYAMSHQFKVCTHSHIGYVTTKYPEYDAVVVNPVEKCDKWELR